LCLVAVGPGCATGGDGSDTGENSGNSLTNGGGDGDAGNGDDAGDDSGGSSGDNGTTSGSNGKSGSSSSSGGSKGSSGSTTTTKKDAGGGQSVVEDSSGSDPTMLPTVMGSCPTFAASSGGTITVSAGGGTIQANVWAGSATGGPLIIYWHGTASSPSAEVPISFDTNALATAGGMVVGFVSSSRTGATTGDTGDAVWYTSDGAFADQVVACAIQQKRIDPRHIHTAGYSAGGLQTVWMWFARSGYLASVISYSGGDSLINKAAMQDPAHPPPAIAAHGAMGSDQLVLDFAQASATWEGDIKTAGGFSIDCNDGGSHLDFFTKRAPPLKPVALQFFQDHPYGVKPEPYTTLPSGFPTYCKID
jgi:dienelactone hydrolase